jgi:UDP-N-acetylglucosamine acyltransferase
VVASETYIHPLALVEEGARLGTGVHVGPFCHVGADAVLGDGVRLVSHVAIMGATTIGEASTVYPSAVLGAPPQNFKHKGERTTLVIGQRCTIREAVTIHVGSDSERGETRIGDDCYFMANSHVAHDCTVGNGVIMANYSGLGGHAEIGDRVNIAGYAAVHQFVRVGRNAFIAGYAAVVGDVIPYGMAYGDRARLRGLNVVGLRRSGMKASDVARMRQAYRHLFAPESPLAENIEAVGRDYADFAPVADIVAFLSARGKRHFTVPGRGRADDDEAGGQD